MFLTVLNICTEMSTAYKGIFRENTGWAFLHVRIANHKFSTCYFHFLVIYFFVKSFIINLFIVYNKLLRSL